MLELRGEFQRLSRLLHPHRRRLLAELKPFGVLEAFRRVTKRAKGDDSTSENEDHEGEENEEKRGLHAVTLSYLARASYPDTPATCAVDLP